MFVWLPIVTELISPLTTHWNHTLDSGPIDTLPTTVAFGATKVVLSTLGAAPSNENKFINVAFLMTAILGVLGGSNLDQLQYYAEL